MHGGSLFYLSFEIDGRIDRKVSRPQYLPKLQFWQATGIGIYVMLSCKYLVAGILALPLAVGAEAYAGLPASGFGEIVAQCAPGVSEKTLGKVVSHESRSNPYAIGLNSRTERLPRQPRNIEEAVATAEWLYARGYSFDSGFGQINSQNIQPLGLTFEELFTPCSNLRAAGQILSGCYSRAVDQGYSEGQPALHAALSCYNTGSFTKGIDNGYVAMVAAASPATLAVPALDTSPGEASAPIKLQATTPKEVRQVMDPAVQEGHPDAFSGFPGDAFVAPPAQDEPPKQAPGGDQ